MKIHLYITTILVIYNCAFGDYFGRNKVQYDEFRFKVLKTESFDILYYNSEEQAIKDAARMLERWHNRYKLIFDLSLPKNQPVILYANHADFQQTNAVSEILSQEIGGVTEGLMNRIIIPLTGVNTENDHVLGHELTHAYHYLLMKSSEAGIGGGQQIPLWFIEGMAEYLSIGSYAPLTSMWMRDAVLFNDVPTIEEISKNPQYFPYRFGHALWAFIAAKYGDGIVKNLFDAVLQHGWYKGFTDIFGEPVDSLSNQWRSAILNNYTPSLKDRSKPSQTGYTIIDKGSINLSPIISPDGKQLVYFSTSDLFSIDLFLSDISSKKIIKKLVSTESDKHFDALRFINTSCAWSPDGKSIAFTVFKKGDNAIVIMDLSSKRIRKTITITETDEISYLAWSPDGFSIAFSGSSGAISDLFLYNLKDNQLQRLTNDRYSQLQPSWSPDGKSIAFATDRGGYTNLDSLTFSSLKIGLLQLETGAISLISIAEWAKHINPQFSPDGSSIFFVSDPDGFSDIYRYSLSSEEFFRVTKIATGISGLTELAPAMSISSQSGRLAFSIYEKSDYKIQCLNPENTIGTLFIADKNEYDRAIKLPPNREEYSIVNKYLQQSSPSLPSEKDFTQSDYHPKLKLLYIGQMYAGFSAGAMGVGFGGGISFLFSDLLGDHLLGLGTQINGSFKDIAAETFYMNMNKRLNWGIVASRIPYLYTRTTLGSDTATVNGSNQSVQKFTFYDQRIYDNQLSLLLDFPFSTNRRIEITSGYNRISYDYLADQIKVHDGSIVERSTIKPEQPTSLNLFQSSIALVGDFSYFGFTGPVIGRRFRLEFQQTAGSLLYSSLLFDYRQYVFANPVTIAFRFMHLGRYLRDSEDESLSQLFLGYDTYIRGYNSYSFDLSQCADDDNNCPEFQRLIGSRIGVLNLELRLPILGNSQFGLINFPYIPTDFVAFFDGGVSWTKNSRPSLKLATKNKERVPVFSAGGAARVNLFNLLVLQIYAAYPFQRTDKEWVWGLFFAPGW